jgi:hypothetical protein
MKRAPGRDRAEGLKISETLSLSIFTIEADRKPLLAFAAKKYQEVEAFCADERVLTKLRSVKSGGVPLCDDHSILRVRLDEGRFHARVRRGDIRPGRCKLVDGSRSHEETGIRETGRPPGRAGRDLCGAPGLCREPGDLVGGVIPPGRLG